MQEVSNLVIKVSSDQVQAATTRLDNLSRASDRLMGYLKGLVTAAAALAVFRAASQAIGEFQTELAGVRAVTAASTEDMAKLSDMARRMGESTRYSAAQVAAGMKFLGQAGFSTNQIIAATPGLLNLATAGEMSMAEAADVASAALAGFRLSAADATRVADAFAVAAGETNTTVQQMGEAMKFVAPIAATLGMSVEDVSAAIGVLSNAGIQGGMAGTTLREVLSSLAAPSREAQDALRVYGVTMAEVNPATHSFTQILERLSKAGLDAAGAFTIFGNRGAPGILALTSQTGRLKELNDQLAKSSGRAGEMSAIMGDTLPGDFLKLSSAVKELWLSIGDAGLTGVMRDATQATTELVLKLADLFKSGEVTAWAELVASKLALVSDGFENLATNIMGAWAMAMNWVEGDGKSTVKTIIDIFVLLPENIRASVQGIGATFGLWVEYATAAGRGIYDTIAGWFNYLIDTAKNVGKEIMSHLNPYADDFDYTKAQADAYDKFTNRVSDGWDKATQHINDARDAYGEVVTAIMDEWDANVASSDDRLARIAKLSDAYQKLKADRKAAEDEAGAKVAGTPVGDIKEAAPTHVDPQAFDRLRTQLMSEEEQVQESYQRQLELIRNNTQEGSEMRLTMERQLNEKLAVEMSTAHEAHAERLDAQYKAEQDQLQAQYDARLLNEEEFQRASLANWNRYTANLGKVADIGNRTVMVKNLEMYSQVLDLASGLSGQMSNLVSQNNAAAKAMFIASKAIAIAQAVVNTELAATKALAEGGFFLGIPMATVIRATGYASVALMAAQSVADFSGMHDHGGMIGAGKWGIAGENGPEIIKGPAVVTSTRTTADMGGGNGRVVTPVTITVENHAGVEVTATKQQTDDGMLISMVLRKVTDSLTGQVNSGGSKLTDALERSYGLRRGAA